MGCLRYLLLGYLFFSVGCKYLVSPKSQSVLDQQLERRGIIRVFISLAVRNSNDNPIKISFNGLSLEDGWNAKIPLFGSLEYSNYSQKGASK